MDISTFETNDLANEGVVMEIQNPDTFEILLDDDGNPMWLQLRGTDSDVHKAVQHRANNRRLKQAYQHRGDFSGTRAEDVEQEALTQLTKCTVAWHLVVDKKFPPCTEEEVRKVYARFPWLREQAEKWREDRSHFFVSSKESSLSTRNGQPVAKEP